MPLIFEMQDGSFEEELFWKTEVKAPSSPDVRSSTSGSRTETVDGEPQFVLEDDDDEDPLSSAGNGDSVPPTPQPPKEKEELLPSLAEELFTHTIDLLFCCGFTLPTSIQIEHHKINYVIW